MSKVVVGDYVVPVVYFYQKLRKLFFVNVECFESAKKLKYLDRCCTKFFVCVMMMVEVEVN